jgi:hypothetical protein
MIELPDKPKIEEKLIHGFLDMLDINQVNIKETIRENSKQTSNNSPELRKAF